MALVLLCLAAGSLAVGESRPAEGAVWSAADISSAGPLTHIFIGNNLSCQVAHTGDAQYEMYSPSDQQGDCGTFVLVGGSVYGNGSFGSDFELTPVSQSAVTGSGTSGSPYEVVTVADAGVTGIRVTETDSYIVGNEFYRTDVRIDNTSDATAAVRVYRSADCYLGGSDSGFGFADPATKTVACTEHANNSPAGRVEMWTPITPASHYYESTCCSNVETVVSGGGELPDTCDCNTSEDNGAAIDWNVSVGAAGNTTVSSYSAFSPTGAGLPNQTPTATAATVVAKPTPCIGGIVTSRCPQNIPAVNVTTTPAPPATATSVPATPVPPQPTATPPGGGAAGVITGPNTGSGPGASQTSLGWLLLAGALLSMGAIVSTAAIRARRR